MKNEKPYTDQITNLDPRRELPSVVRYLSADRLMGIIEYAQNGDTRERRAAADKFARLEGVRT